MYVSVDSTNSVVVKEVDTFGEFYVDAGGHDLQTLHDLLQADGASRIADGFAWLRCSFLEAAAIPEGTDRASDFAGMLAFARSRDWTRIEESGGAETVRAHIVGTA